MFSRRLLAVLLVVATAFGARPGVATGQDDGGEAWISVAPRTGAVVVELGALLEDRALANAIHEGLPLRISVDAELWADRFFDSEEGREQWKASVLYDPVTLRYEVQVGDAAIERFRTLAEARTHLQSAFDLDLRPARPGRYYYLATVEMATLSLSDLEELRRWLSGDLAPAVGGDADVDGAVARGVRRLFVRALGLPTRRVRLRTEAFTFEGESDDDRR
ncbi:MAG: DUF4390 domain-containing protein [Longimicrobiales bacterium]